MQIKPQREIKNSAQGNRTLYTPFKYSIYCPLMQDEKKNKKQNQTNSIAKSPGQINSHCIKSAWEGNYMT